MDHCFSLQNDWESTLSVPGGKAWISCKKRGEKGCHDQLVHEEGNELHGDVFQGAILSPYLLSVTHGPSGESVLFVAPRQTFTMGKQVTGVDVSDGGLGVCTLGDNRVLVWDLADGQIRRELDGHLGEAYTARIFPSGIVALTAGADLQIRIVSMVDGKCPVILKGHTAAVTDTAIVERGKNVISVSKDGTVRLWSCGEARSLVVLAELSERINGCQLLDVGTPGSGGVGDQLAATPAAEDAGEVNTGGKVLAVGGEEGLVAILDIAARRVLSRYRCPSAVNAVALNENILAAGCESGEVFCFRPEDIAKPVKIVHQTNSPVRSLHLLSPPPDDGHGGDGVLAVGHQDGTLGLLGASGHVYLTGPDCEAVSSLASDEVHLYAASRDGRIRKYRLTDILSPAV